MSRRYGSLPASVVPPGLVLGLASPTLASADFPVALAYSQRLIGRRELWEGLKSNELSPPRMSR